MLDQSNKCTIKRLSEAEAFRRIYAQLIVCDWNSGYMEKLLECLEKLVSEVPVYYMPCTPDQQAVALLKATISQQLKEERENSQL